MEFWDTYKSYYNKKCWICWHLEINVAIGYILMVITYTEIKYTPYLITVQLGSHIKCDDWFVSETSVP